MVKFNFNDIEKYVTLTCATFHAEFKSEIHYFRSLLSFKFYIDIIIHFFSHKQISFVPFACF